MKKKGISAYVFYQVRNEIWNLEDVDIYTPPRCECEGHIEVYTGSISTVKKVKQLLLNAGYENSGNGGKYAVIVDYDEKSFYMTTKATFDTLLRTGLIY